MDKQAALQMLADLDAYIQTLPNPAEAQADLAAVIAYLEAQTEDTMIAPPAPPVITTPRKVISSSGQVARINATRTEPLKDIWASNSLRALIFNAARDLPQPLEISDILIDSCREVVAPDGAGPGVNNIILRRVHSPAVGKRGIYIRYDSKNWLVEDCYFKARGVNTETGVIPMGVQLKETAHDLTFRRCVVEGFQTDLSARTGSNYWNADGFVSERGNYNITFEDCVALNCTDGGFDLKSDNTWLDRCRAEGCGRNFRFWDSVSAGQLESINPIKRGGAGGSCHFWLAAKAPMTIPIKRLVARGNTLAPIFVADGSALVTITVDSHDFQVPPGTPITKGNINLVLK